MQRSPDHSEFWNVLSQDGRTAVKRSSILAHIKEAKVIEVTSSEELRTQLGVTLDPAVIEQIKKDGGAVILGFLGKNKDF
jgi:hypothetical protein